MGGLPHPRPASPRPIEVKALGVERRLPYREDG
jgi:hypothetical protein